MASPPAEPMIRAPACTPLDDDSDIDASEAVTKEKMSTKSPGKVQSSMLGRIHRRTPQAKLSKFWLVHPWMVK